MLVAYIDPGFGALIWQMAVSAFVGLLFYLKQTRKWIISFFRRIFRRELKAENPVVGFPNPTVETKVDAK